MSGMLKSDTIVRGAMDSLRGKWTSSTATTNSKEASQLYQIGLATGADFTNGGKIELDEEKLKAAIERNPEEVYQLFTNPEKVYFLKYAMQLLTHELILHVLLVSKGLDLLRIPWDVK